MRRILVATDFTESSERALDWAIELAAQLQATVTAMHAYELPALALPTSSTPG